MNPKLKKMLPILAIVVGALILGAIVVGILNALLANGTWSFGWSDYRYDDSNYRIGDGTIAAPNVTEIEVDWIDGRIEILPCDDMFLSVTEFSANELTEDSRLRWRVSEDGKSLSIKYRKSSWYLGNSENKDKFLILRVPKKLFGQLTSLKVKTVAGDVTVKELEVPSISLESTSAAINIKSCTCTDFSAKTVNGAITFDGSIAGKVVCKSVNVAMTLRSAVCPQSVTVDSVNADVLLSLPATSSFSLNKDSIGGDFSTDFAVEQADGVYICGDGSARFEIDTVTGDVKIEKREED
ncbi:MAG: DUF4097 family beta strand repeat protein [Clostridia bacterium]|nr:DUF4097 family beta strand repeat protein [Clostridia bacterium]